MRPAGAQVIISQYYEGTGTNKWLELTNLGSTTVNPASTVLKVRIWSQTSDTGLIAFTGSISTMTINVPIPAGGTILLGNSSNGTTGTSVPYLTASSANQTNNSVIAFNGNDGIALLDANDNVLDRFGTGINAKDVSYIRNLNVTGPSTTYTSSQWTAVSLNAVHTASTNSSVRLGFMGHPVRHPPIKPQTV
ncbi:MAG: lamin tail domain-containing protein [Bacteroidota bacterium]|nr:MAG: lamin tail domain-containing protein [Bacteroidota bacterium]